MLLKISFKNFVNTAFYFIGLTGLLLSYLTARFSGIGWDTAYETDAYPEFKLVPDNIWLYDAYDLVPGLLEYYGFILHQFSEIFLNTFSISNVYSSSNLEIFQWQTLTNILFALFASVAVSIAIFSVTKSSIFASTFFVILNTNPVWLGLLHVNFKDTPIASGLTLVSAGLILSLKTLVKHYERFFSIFFIALGAIIAVGTRAGSSILILVLSVGSIICYLFFHYLTYKKIPNLKFSLISLVLAGVVTILFLLASNPLARNNLIRWLAHSVMSSSKFPHSVGNRTFGRDYLSTDLPWFYIPIWTFAKMPFFYTLVLIFGLVVLVKVLRNSLLIKETLLFIPILFQALIIPLLIIISNSVLYDSIRHVSFIIPALIFIVSLIFYYTFKLVINNQVLQKITFLTLFLLIFINSYHFFAWRPYSYAFINPISNINKIDNYWDLDYWGVSAREGINILKNEYQVSEVLVTPSNDMGKPFGGSSYSSEAKIKDETVGVYFFIRFNHEFSWDRNCKKQFEIKRAGLKIGEGGVCKRNS